MKLRLGKEEDFNFVISSWLKSSRHRFKQLTNEDYFDPYKEKIIDLLQEADVVVMEDEENDLILGFIAFTPEDTVHYVYVKYAFRKMGIAKALIEEASCRWSSIDHAGLDKAKLTFNPLKGN